MRTQRLFVAIPLPDAHKTHCLQLKNEMDEINGLRWTPPENLHLTLVFLGKIDPNDIEEIKQKLELTLTDIPPFEMKAQQSGSSPGRSPNPMVWITFQENKQYIDLALTLRERLSPFVEKMDARSPLAHITLARSPKTNPSTREFIPEFPIENCPGIPVESLELWRSTRGENGSIYNCLGHFDLKG